MRAGRDTGARGAVRVPWGILARMRLALRLVLLAVGLAAAFYGAVYAASESGEVATLRTFDAAGRAQATRLWIVDHAGAEWVRTGHPEKGWFARLSADPRVELERAGSASARTAVPVHDAESARAVNAAFGRKYGAADWIVALSGDASRRVPVRLDPRVE
jgi:hypothetical protein